MIDLGAGMGLCGLVIAALGSHVISTDLAPVLPLLRKNCESNFSPVVLQSELLPIYLLICPAWRGGAGGGGVINLEYDTSSNLLLCQTRLSWPQRFIAELI